MPEAGRIPVAHSTRANGASNYSLVKLFSLQLDLVTSFSIAPLRALFLLGWSVAFLGVAFGVFLFAMRFIQGAAWAAQGVFTLFAVLFFFVGAQFLAFGLLGEYIGRIYQEVRNRPTLSRNAEQSRTEQFQGVVDIPPSRSSLCVADRKEVNAFQTTRTRS